MTTLDLRTLIQRQPAFNHLNDAQLEWLEQEIEQITLPAGQMLMRQGERGDSMYLLLSGVLDVRLSIDGAERRVATLESGAPVGETQLLTGGIRTASVYALEDCTLLNLSGKALASIEAKDQKLHLALLDFIRQRQRHRRLFDILKSIFGEVDIDTLNQVHANAAWLTVPRGKVLFNQGDQADAWYILLDGLLDVQVSREKGATISINRIHNGSSFGEAALLCDQPRAATIVAARDSQLAAISRDTFDKLCVTHPDRLATLTRTLVSQITQPAPARIASDCFVIESKSPRGPAHEIAVHLTDQLAHYGTCTHIDCERLLTDFELPPAALTDESHPAWHRISLIMDELEQQTRYVLLELNSTAPAWKTFCFNRADTFLDVVAADDSVGDWETATDTRDRYLLLLQPPERRLPKGTLAWLNASRANRHLHLRAINHNEIARVARFITGKAIGLVLGGGGARGYGHIGAWQALQDAEVPIDLVGGTSIGSVIAANIALGLSCEQIIEKQKQAIALRPFKKFTLPLVSFVSGKAIDNLAQVSFGDIQIEDLWLPYYCVSTNLTTAQQIVYTRGSLWRATRASGAIPVVTTPVVEGGELLVDGGIVNNLPCDIMRVQGAGHVIASSVSPASNLRVNVARLPTAWQLLLDRLLPWRRRYSVPGMIDILLSTMVLADSQKLTQATACADMLLELPVNQFGMLQFDALLDLVAAGRAHTTARLSETGALDFLNVN